MLICVCRTCLSRPRTGRGPCFPSALPFGYAVVPPPSPPPPSMHHIPLGRLLQGPSFPNARCDERADTHTHAAWAQEENQWREDLASLPTVRSLGKWRGRSPCERLLLMTSLGLRALGLRLFLQQLNASNHLLMSSLPACLWLYVVCRLFQKLPILRTSCRAPPPYNTHKYAPTHTSSNPSPPPPPPPPASYL